MFKLGIFEDERIILDSICNYITWQDFECELVCSSYRGTDIKELITQTSHIDLSYAP